MTFGEFLFVEIAQLVLIISGIFFSAYFSKKGENTATKEDIKDITNKIEDVKTEFYMLQKKFTLYEEKKFEVLALVYSDLYNVQKQVRMWIENTDQDKIRYSSDELDNAGDAFNKMRDNYNRNLIYVPENICKDIDHFIEQTSKAIISFVKSDGQEDEKKEEFIHYTKSIVNESLPNLMKELEKKLRKDLSAVEVK